MLEDFTFLKLFLPELCVEFNFLRLRDASVLTVLFDFFLEDFFSGGRDDHLRRSVVATLLRACHMVFSI